MESYKVMLVEPDTRLLQKLAGVVQNTAGFQVTAAYSTLRDAVNQGSVFRPNLILLDMEKAEDYSVVHEFVQRFPEARILCMGREWTMPAFRAAVKAGAAGYLVAPFTGEELANSVKSFQTEQQVSTVMTFFSPKGKSGRSTLLAHMASSLAARTGSRVGIIDGDLQFGDLALFFNVLPQSTISEAVRDIRFLSPPSLQSYFVPLTEQISFLCGTRGPEYAEQITPDALTDLIQMARGLFRYILIDLPAGFNGISVAACEAADIVHLMTMINTGYEIRHMTKALEIFSVWGNYKTKVHALFNRVDPCTEDMRKALEKEMQFPVYGILPNEYIPLSQAADRGRILSDIAPDSPFRRAVDQIAEKTVHEEGGGRP